MVNGKAAATIKNNQGMTLRLSFLKPMHLAEDIEA